MAASRAIFFVASNNAVRQTLHRFTVEEEETRSSLQNLKFCLASKAPNAEFTLAVDVNKNRKVKTANL
jgi:hypothetical protein